MIYVIIIEKKVETFIKKQSATTAKRIINAISKLAETQDHQVVKS